MGQEKENKLQTLRSLRLTDVPLQDRAHQHSLVSRNDIKNCKLSSTPSNEEVGCAFIITRGVRSNTYPMDSAHQRYRHIHYNCLIHLKPQPLKGTPKVKAYSLQLLYSVVTTTVHCTTTLTPSPPVTLSAHRASPLSVS